MSEAIVSAKLSGTSPPKQRRTTTSTRASRGLSSQIFTVLPTEMKPGTTSSVTATVLRMSFSRSRCSRRIPRTARMKRLPTKSLCHCSPRGEDYPASYGALRGSWPQFQPQSSHASPPATHRHPGSQTGPGGQFLAKIPIFRKPGPKIEESSKKGPFGPPDSASTSTQTKLLATGISNWDHRLQDAADQRPLRSGEPECLSGSELGGRGQ